MIRLNLVKGSLEKQLLENEDPGGFYGTRVTKQLVAPQRNSGIVVCTDSYFSPVPCAIAMRDMGLQFIGVVKTATKQYPHNYIQQLSCHRKVITKVF